ncbi:MAG: hypothetical protein AAGJ79_04735 [Verrucomicrobiota bacterium]
MSRIEDNPPQEEATTPSSAYRSIQLPPPPEPEPTESGRPAIVPPKSDAALAAALEPVMRDNVVRVLKEHPNIIIDIVYPVLGRVIRKSISESIRSLMVAVENSAKSALSVKRMKWRWEAMRTGKPFSQVLLEKCLVYRVEEVLLIHRKTGILALHESLEPERHQDRELVSAMLTAIEDFARDSFQLDDGAILSSFNFGELQLLVKASPHALLAAAVRGTPTQAVHDLLDDTLVTIHETFLVQLQRFDGDPVPLEPIRADLRECLVSQTTE